MRKRTDKHQPAHAQSLIRVFILNWNTLQYPMILYEGSKDPGQMAYSRSLDLAFAVHKWLECISSLAGSNINNFESS